MENNFIYKINANSIEEGEKVFGLLSNLGIEWKTNLTSLLGLNLPLKIFAISSDGFKFVIFSLKYSLCLEINQAKEITSNELQSEEFKKELLKIRILGRLQDE